MYYLAKICRKLEKNEEKIVPRRGMRLFKILLCGSATGLGKRVMTNANTGRLVRTPSESVKDQTTSKKYQRINGKHQRKFSLSRSLLLGLNTA